MAQPRAYTRQANFTDHTTESPSDPQVGSKLDSEFDALNLTLNDIRANLALLQRDDTKVANSSIHTEALSNAVLALIKATENGYGIKGAWAASTAYGIGDLVESSQATYLCHTAHTSGSSLTAAEIASYWILLANAAILATASAVDKLNGDGSITAFTLSENNPSGDTDVLVFVNGSLQTPTSDYTISGTTLTFSTAPSSGTNNVIAWGTSTVVEAAKTAAQSARDTALAHRDDASQHKTTAERWAKLEDATVVDADTSVDSGEYSAKEYAVGDTVTTGSAKEWASKAYNSAVVTSPSNEYSAKHYAQNIQEWATKDDGAVSGSDYSAKAYASIEGANAPPEGSAKEWATATAAQHSHRQPAYRLRPRPSKKWRSPSTLSSALAIPHRSPPHRLRLHCNPRLLLPSPFQQKDHFEPFPASWKESENQARSLRFSGSQGDSGITRAGQRSPRISTSNSVPTAANSGGT